MHWYTQKFQWSVLPSEDVTTLLRSHAWPAQQVETSIAVKVLNLMFDFGHPEVHPHRLKITKARLYSTSTPTCTRATKSTAGEQNASSRTLEIAAQPL
jgi:hypothetical protein